MKAEFIRWIRNTLKSLESYATRKILFLFLTKYRPVWAEQVIFLHIKCTALNRIFSLRQRHLAAVFRLARYVRAKRLRLHLNRVTTEQHSAVIRSQRQQDWLCLIFLKRNILLKIQVRWVSILKKNLQNFKINIRIKLQMSEMQVF